MKPTLRPCPRCKGAGSEPLPPWLQDVFDLVRLSAKTPMFVADKLGISVQAANNRLSRLVEAGLLFRKPVNLPEGGRAYLYRRNWGFVSASSQPSGTDSGTQSQPAASHSTAEQGG